MDGLSFSCWVFAAYLFAQLLLRALWHLPLWLEMWRDLLNGAPVRERASTRQLRSQRVSADAPPRRDAER